tara:strand:+ start:310 stop:1422 length:1113 start_codon:yes stop_codon:yes gene_type:complete
MTKAAELAKMGEVLTNSQIGGRRNIVINGAMQVAQRATSATGVGASEGYFTLDRFEVAPSTNGRATMSQSTDTPDGFSSSLKLDCTTADTSVAAGEFFILRTCFEGQDLQQFKKGTSSAEKVTVSFYVKGNASATYTCELQDTDNSRQNSQTFAVTTSWNRIILTFVGDTTGAFDNDNAQSLRLGFWLHGGTSYSGGTFASNTWHTADNKRVGDGQTSFFDSTNRELFITGLQMEVGSQATPFEHRSFGEELALCYRYYFKCGLATNTFMGGAGWARDNNTFHVSCPYPVTMRAAPSAVETSGTPSHYEINYRALSAAVSSGPNFDTANRFGGFVSGDVSGTPLTAGDSVRLVGSAGGGTGSFLAWSAEL